MALTDVHGPYTVTYCYSRRWVEIFRGHVSLTFMHGDDADTFLLDYDAIPDEFLPSWLSEYDHLAHDAGWS